VREACRIEAVHDDGTLELAWVASGERSHARLQGVRPVQPLPPLYREILVDRVGSLEFAPRAERRGRDGDSVLVNVHVFAWHDKSGDVWRDIALALLKEGVATVEPGDYPERADYERAATRASA
jgi:hypothetical protein